MRNNFGESGTLPWVRVKGPAVRVHGPEIRVVGQRGSTRVRILELRIKKKFFGWLLGWLVGLDDGSRKRPTDFLIFPQLPINYILPCYTILSPAALLSKIVD